MGILTDDTTLDSYEINAKMIKSIHHKLDKFEAIFKEKREMILNQYEEDFIETSFGYLNKEVSDEDFKKVKEIEIQIVNCISEKVILDVLIQANLFGRFNNRNLKKSAFDFSNHLIKHIEENDKQIKAKNGYTEEEEIDKLIEPLENKKVYIPKADVSILRKNIINHLLLNGMTYTPDL